MATNIEIITKLIKTFKILFLGNLVPKFELPSFLRKLVSNSVWGSFFRIQKLQVFKKIMTLRPILGRFSPKIQDFQFLRKLINNPNWECCFRVQKWTFKIKNLRQLSWQIWLENVLENLYFLWKLASKIVKYKF